MRFGQEIQTLPRSGRVADSLAAGAFYVGLAGCIFGLIRVLRASIERQTRDRVGLASLAIGAVFVVVAIAVYLTGPKTVLPF